MSKTTPELLEEIRKIEEDPANHAPPGAFFKFTTKARKKLDRLRADITHNLATKRAAEGRPVPCDGYSGRKQNKRR